MIQGLEEFLETFKNTKEITGMVPGRIKPVKKPSPIKVQRLIETQSGVKALIHSGCAIQEVFFVGETNILLGILEAYKKKEKL